MTGAKDGAFSTNRAADINRTTTLNKTKTYTTNKIYYQIHKLKLINFKTKTWFSDFYAIHATDRCDLFYGQWGQEVSRVVAHIYDSKLTLQQKETQTY